MAALDVDRTTFFLGAAPAPGLVDSGGIEVGFGDASMRRYASDFFPADPFRGARATRLLRRHGTVRLGQLRGSLSAREQQYVRRFLRPEGIGDQHTLWLDTGAGVHGYLSVFADTGEQVPDRVGTALTAMRPVLSNLLRLQLSAAPDRHRHLPCDLLSPAERRVHDLVVQGRSNRQVASTAGLSVHTVKKHLTRIYRTCGVTSRAELIARHVAG